MIDLSKVPDELFYAEVARRSQAKRKIKSGGRNGGRKPDSTQPRCACGEMTLKRATARAHKCNATPSS
jgi:hypothetical protein